MIMIAWPEMSIDEFAMKVILPILAVSIVAVFIRLVRGPTVADRVVALDMMGMLGIGVIATYAVGRGQAVFLDVAVVLALVLFLGTVAFAHYLEKRAQS